MEFPRNNVYPDLIVGLVSRESTALRKFNSDISVHEYARVRAHTYAYTGRLLKFCIVRSIYVYRGRGACTCMLPFQVAQVNRVASTHLALQREIGASG